MNWAVLIVFMLPISPSFAAIYFKFISHLPQDYYASSRDASVYRGVLLSYSPAKKYQICRDLFSEYFTETNVEISNITGRVLLITDDESRNQQNQQYSLIVGRISAIGVHSPRGRGDDFFFKCVGKNFGLRTQESIILSVSSAFQPGLMYDIQENMTFDRTWITLKRYIGMSPEYELSEQSQLEIETQYGAIRQNISALAGESPEYVKLIESNDTFSALSLWQKFLLCSTVIASPAYETIRSKFPLDWTNYKNSAAKNTFKHDKKQLIFINNEYSAKKWVTDCVYCTSSAGETDPSSIPMNLLVTRAYENSDSMYVLMEKEGLTTFKGFFRNVPILINAHVTITDNPPLNFREL